MSMKEIDEAELVRLQNVASVVNKMLSNPESRIKVLEAQKIVNPQSVVPEIDATKPFKEAIGSVQEKLSALEKKMEEKETAREEAAQKKELENKWMLGRKMANETGYTEDGIKKLEEFMVENGIAEHRLAMPAFEREHPLPAPVASSRQGFDAFQVLSDTGEEMKKLLETQGQDNGVVRSLVNKALNDVRSR